ncbi:hypothetical protein T11_10777 [Trichinella zimbabwensis]|uniref:Uncharacterized protein n=1 Tax=Trichinella zimbabwensis TaxID=268475 RepID=A0A0V1I2H6_9BILA|nr:hypothetical protein T11_10777 [Trichinella zimbabwensis]
MRLVPKDVTRATHMKRTYRMSETVLSDRYKGFYRDQQLLDQWSSLPAQ